MDIDVEELCHEVWSAPLDTYVHLTRTSLNVAITTDGTLESQGYIEGLRTEAPKDSRMPPKHLEGSRGHMSLSWRSKGRKR